MRRAFALLVLVIGVLGATGVAVAAGDVNGRKCADISFTGNDVFYTSDGTVTLTLQVAAASCPSITYSLVVLDDATSTSPLAVDTERGDGSAFNPDGTDFVTLQRTVSDDDNIVCIYATSASPGRVFDRAPDETASPNCAALTKGGAGGGSGFE